MIKIVADLITPLLTNKYLQMIVLLLSLLNDDDLADIPDFLEATYQLKADRKHLEVLFLKVILLTSINSSVFLQAMTMAYGLDTPETNKEPYTHTQMSCTWDSYIKDILSNGFLLPGTLGDFNKKQPSWIPKWPKYGYDTATTFKHLCTIYGRIKVRSRRSAGND